MVTDSMFTVKKKHYRLIGIIKHGLRTIRPLRAPGLLLAITGVLVAALAWVDWITRRLPEPEVLNRTVDQSLLLLLPGALLVVAGLILVVTVKTRYAVHISTAEGENDVIVSSQREYVNQIVNALTRAVRQAVWVDSRNR